MFSLCIPTMERFDTFLKVNLLKYLEDKNIDEIIKPFKKLYSF